MTTEPMWAITIRLPYAAAVRSGVKQVENRSRPIHEKHIGTRVAIHASATWSKVGGEDPRILDWWWGKHRSPDRSIDATDFSRLFRKVVAVATIAGCHEAAWPLNEALTCCKPFGDRRYGDRGAQAWHIELADIVALDQPVGPVRGSLAVPWTLPADIAAQVRAQVGVVL